MYLLAIETSCDETAVAILKDKELIANLVSSQVELHKKFGGIIPEVAARRHLEVINPLIDEAVNKAGIKLQDLNAIAVVNGPGLEGALITGVIAAKTISAALNIPLIAINHIEAHIYANFLENNNILFPAVGLVVSGGHTVLIYVKEHFNYEIIGQTLDDACGEVLDKIARFLNLGYPGGPIIDKLAKEGNVNIRFTEPLPDRLDFSFSGLKTQVINYVRVNKFKLEDLCASFQFTMMDTLCKKTIKAAEFKKVKNILLGGGVAVNSLLREIIYREAKKKGIAVFIPQVKFCLDNAAMVGIYAYFKYIHNRFNDFDIDVIPRFKITT